MKIIHDLTSSDIERPTVLTWGVFDGLHIGHQEIIRTVVERGRALRITPMLITFEPHPRAVLRPETAPPFLQTFDQRREGLERLGIEQTIVIHFTLEFAATTAEQFLREIIFGRLDAREVYLGEGVAFGHNRQGRMDLVIRIAQELGRLAASVGEVKLRGHRVRSTTIRRLLKAGHINLPRRMLGRPYEIIGEVIKGRGIGGELLVSTANLLVENAVIPAQGVYVTLALVEGIWRPSVTNIGTRPTFGGDPEVSVECHILDIQRDLLGHRLRLQFLHRLRDEKRFPDVAALRQQIARDVQRTRRYFSSPLVKKALGLE
ncbi:MAG: riboflavin biosynthesis protein RibF [Acidobacteria bacterium]|nr:riboflavin biosynthesis protein RibF [Acidobacteriota bacterium]